MYPAESAWKNDRAGRLTNSKEIHIRRACIDLNTNQINHLSNILSMDEKIEQGDFSPKG